MRVTLLSALFATRSPASPSSSRRRSRWWDAQGCAPGLIALSVLGWAIPVYSQTSTVPVPAGALSTTSPLRSALLDQLQTVVTPPLPPLGEASTFLPAPDPKASIRLVIRLSDRRVYVYHRDQLQISYPIAIGREGWETPTGSYQVLQMQRDPIWQNPFTGELIPPGADNPLGTRWIGFWTDGTNYIGFHGTPNASSVGQAASHGCIRMYDSDVAELFELVQVGTPVEVMP